MSLHCKARRPPLGFSAATVRPNPPGYSLVLSTIGYRLSTSATKRLPFSCYCRLELRTIPCTAYYAVKGSCPSHILLGPPQRSESRTTGHVSTQYADLSTLVPTFVTSTCYNVALFLVDLETPSIIFFLPSFQSFIQTSNSFQTRHHSLPKQTCKAWAAQA